MSQVPVRETLNAAAGGTATSVAGMVIFGYPVTDVAALVGIVAGLYSITFTTFKFIKELRNQS